jgi:hypothetical protein
MRTLALLLLAACAHSPVWRPPTCDPKMIYVGGDVELVYGRLRTSMARTYSVIEDPLTRTISTDWHAVPLFSVQKARCDIPATITTYEVRFTVAIEGQFPFRIVITSQARGRERVEATGELRHEGPTQLPKFEEAFATRIRADLDDLIVRCDNTSFPSRSRCDRALGTIADLAVPTLPEGVTVASPRMCERNSAYLRVERSVGARALGMERAHPTRGGFGRGCAELPRDATSCPEINVTAVLHEAARRLRREGIAVNGAGVGPCGVVGTYDVVNLSVGVMDWKDAGPAVAILGEVLAEYDLRGYAGVGVVGPMCGEAL